MLSCFDMRQGYFQTRISPEDEPLTTFVCDDGIFKFLQTLFGGKACGSSFICNVQNVIEPIRGFTESFVDDPIVHSSTIYGEKPFTIHLQDIERFLQRIKETGLTFEVQILPM